MQTLNRLTMDIKQVGPANTSAADAKRADRAPEKAERESLSSPSPIARQPAEFAPSSDAQKVSAAIDKANRQPEVDTTRVDRLKAAVRDGNYPVDANALADNIIRFEKAVRGA